MLLEMIYFEKLQQAQVSEFSLEEKYQDHFCDTSSQAFTKPATFYISATLTSSNFRACSHSDLCKKSDWYFINLHLIPEIKSTFDLLSSKANINLLCTLPKTSMIQDSCWKKLHLETVFLSDPALMSLHFTFPCTYSAWLSSPPCYHTKPAWIP